MAHLLRRPSALAQVANTERIVAFCKAHTSFISHQIAMIKLRRLKAKRTIKQNLSRRGFQQVGAAHDFGDSHRMVVSNYRELISGNVISSPDDEVSEIAAGNVTLRSKMLVGKRDRLAIGNAKAPIHAFWFLESPRIIS